MAADQFAFLPLGLVNTDLLKMRAALFGQRVDVQLTCSHCHELLEIPLHLEELLARAEEQNIPAEIEVAGFHFRLPASCDLAAVAGSRDPQSAALGILEGCCLQMPDGERNAAEVLALADAEFKKADPMADLSFDVVCPACKAHTDAFFDPGALLWQEVQAYARSLLAQVHSLARAYGWTESDVLALSPQRRKVYLDMVCGDEQPMKRGPT